MNPIDKNVLALMVVATALVFAIPTICEGYDSQYVAEGEIFSTDDGLKFEIIEGTDTVSLIGYTDIFSPTSGFEIPSTVSHEGTTFTVKSVGNDAFHGCKELKGTLTIPRGIKKIGSGAFTDTMLTSIVVDANNKHYCSVDGILFNKDKTVLMCAPRGLVLGSYTVPESVEKIANNAFENNVSLTSITLNKGLSIIGKSAFFNCTGLTGTLEVPDSVTKIGGYAFYYCTGITELVLNEGLTKIGGYAFFCCDMLSGTLTIPGSVTGIGGYAFEGCSELTELVLNEGLTKIGKSAFFNCTGLTGTLTIPGSVTRIGVDTFNNCTGLEGLVLNEGLMRIGKSAFFNCYMLSDKITIPGSVMRIGNWAFSSTNISYIEVDPLNKNYSSLDGVLFNKNKTVLVSFPSGMELKSYTVPYGVVKIGRYAFHDCTWLTGTITIPGSVKRIGEDAFNGCTGITGLVLNKGLRAIGKDAFNNCTGLTGTITIPGSVKVIGGYAFYNCKDINGLVLNDGLIEICSYAFAGCDGLIGVLKIPGSVKKIDENAFDRYTGITTVFIDGDVSGINTSAFNEWVFYDTDGTTKITDMGNLPGWKYTGTTDKMVRQSPLIRAFAEFDTDGGSGSVDMIKANVGDTIVLPYYDGTKSKCTFEGWSLDGMTYKPGDSYTLSGSVTFKAIWKYNGGSSDNTVLIAGAVVAIIAIIAIAAVVVYKKKKP